VTNAGTDGAVTDGPLADDPLTDDALTGAYRVWQRKRGHRYSIDDVLTAHEACVARPDASLDWVLERL